MTNNINEFTNRLRSYIEEDQLVKVTLGKPVKGEKNLMNIYVKIVNIKHTPMLSFSYRYTNKDITKNYSIEEGIDLINSLIGNTFLNGHLISIYQNVQIEVDRKPYPKISYSAPTHKEIPTRTHNREKNRYIEIENNVYLKRLGVVTHSNKIAKNMEGKYRQINKYVEILEGLISSSNLLQKSQINFIDMGSGKGYLTFALYDYLKNIMKLNVHAKGVEIKENMVNLCNSISKEAKFTNLKFVVGQIKNYEIENVDILIALHACDTATDDAIYKGIVSDAKLIICAPCCHKQVRKQMDSHCNIKEILKHGILKERQAEILTDGIRSLLLEYFGYKTSVFEFISTEHTSKNIMIAGVKTNRKIDRKSILKNIESIKNDFGIKNHYLEDLLLK